MFVPLSDSERQTFYSQNKECFIPGYTGHCPTLRFQYGSSYGANTKKILQELRDKNVVKSVQRSPYRQYNEHDKAVYSPVVRSKGQTADPASELRGKASKYIIGYTGFIPTINFRYGKSFGRAADDSVYDFGAKQRRVREQRLELEAMRARSAPKLTPVRNGDEVGQVFRVDGNFSTFKEREISPDCPPIAGYTGYISKVKGNEESLSQRYNNVVKRSLTLLREDRENKRRAMAARRRYLRDNDGRFDDEPVEPRPYQGP